MLAVAVITKNLVPLSRRNAIRQWFLMAVTLEQFLALKRLTTALQLHGLERGTQISE